MATSRLIRTLLAALAIGAVGAAGASAKSYCVNPATGCDVSEPTIAAAIASANADATGSDVIQLGAQTYPETGLVYSGTVPLTLQGKGSAQTSIAPAANGTIFKSTSTQPVTVQDLTGTIPAGTSNGGLWDHGGPLTVTHAVINFSGAPTLATGVTLDHGGSITNSSLSVPGTNSCYAIWNRGAETLTVADDTISAFDGIRTDGSVAGTLNAHRLHVTVPGTANGGASNGAGLIVANPNTATVDDSLFIVGPGANGLFSTGGGGSDATLTARHVTVVSDGSSPSTQTAFTVYASSGPGSGILNLFDSLSHGVSRSIYAFSAGGGTAIIGGDYNDFPGATNASDSHISLTGASTFTPGAHNVDVDPRFVGASDFHLLASSPLLNVVPGPLPAGESTSDLDGHARVGANGRSDIGAYQHQPPTASASASPTSATVGTPFTFTGSGADTDPGDPLSYHWAFDDGASASTAVAMHAFASAGMHAGTLTVTDATGLTATATATVTVTAVVTIPPPLPDLESFTLSSPKFAVGGRATPISGALAAAVKRGTKFSFHINTAAAITLTFQRALPGRRSGRSCLAPRRHHRHDKRCTRYTAMGHIDRTAPGAGSYTIAFSGRIAGSSALPVGSYRAILIAINATGPATPRTASFNVVAAPKKHKKKKH